MRRQDSTIGKKKQSFESVLFGSMHSAQPELTRRDPGDKRIPEGNERGASWRHADHQDASPSHSRVSVPGPLLGEPGVVPRSPEPSWGDGRSFPMKRHTIVRSII